MKIIIIEDNLAIPLRNIDYIRLLEDDRVVNIYTKVMGHRIPFDTVDEAIEFFDYVVDMVDKLK